MAGDSREGYLEVLESLPIVGFQANHLRTLLPHRTYEEITNTISSALSFAAVQFAAPAAFCLGGIHRIGVMTIGTKCLRHYSFARANGDSINPAVQAALKFATTRWGDKMVPVTWDTVIKYVAVHLNGRSWEKVCIFAGISQGSIVKATANAVEGCEMGLVGDTRTVYTCANCVRRPNQTCDGCSMYTNYMSQLGATEPAPEEVREILEQTARIGIAC